MKNYKLIIFDWDGTLMDSVDRIVSSMKSAAKIVGLTIPSTQSVKDIIGLSLPIAFDKLFSDITEEQAKAMLVQYKYQFIEVNMTPMPLFNDAALLLANLQKQEKLLAIATGKAREGLTHVLKVSGMAHFFNSTRCAGEVPSKPDPTMLISILDELNIAAQDAIMVGDSSHDLAMAQAANIDSIGVTFGVHDRQTLEKYQPKAIVDSLVELQCLLV
jgi:phosphoglycolate phosphatase